MSNSVPEQENEIQKKPSLFKRICERIFRKEDDDFDDVYEELPIETPEDDPTVQIFFDDQEDSYEGHIYREIKIDLAGRVYFKIDRKWVLQKNVDEIIVYNLRTAKCGLNTDEADD